MITLSKLCRYVLNSNYRFAINGIRFGHYKSMGDKEYLTRVFHGVLGYKPDLDHPATFNEKLQWLKLHDRKNIYTTMVDKYETKFYVAKLIGEEYIIPTLGVWDGFDEIDFKCLPDQFVLKCTHDSGSVVIVPDKSIFDREKARKKLERGLHRDFYAAGREWPYKNVKPRIIAEAYMGDGGIADLRDFKLQCFDGCVDNILVCTDRFSSKGVRYFYFDRDWNFLPYTKEKYDDIDLNVLNRFKPQNLALMISLAEVLSAGFPELRVDFYEINGKVYFGELTFYSDGGFDNTITREADVAMGEKLKLSIDA